MSSAEDATRRKKAGLLFALALLVAAMILTIISLDPGTREPETAGPSQPTPTITPSTTAPPSLSGLSSLGGDQTGSGRSLESGVQCEVGSGGLVSCPQNFTIAGNTEGLFPGGTVQLPLTIDNPNPQGIRVTSITVTVTDSSSTSCGTSFLQTSNYTGPGFIVGANGSNTISLPLTMSRSATDACQSVTFTLSYGGKAEQA